MRKLAPIFFFIFATRIWAAYSYQAAVSLPAPTGGPLTNFTVFITGTDTKLKSAPNGGRIQHSVTRTYGSYSQTVPADLIVSSDAEGTSLYTWGFKFWDPVNGKVFIPVLIPNYNAAMTLYVSIGNPAVSTYQGGSPGSEFDANTQAYWHMGDGSSVVLADFSSHGYNAVNSGATATNGNIDGAVNFPGSAGASAGANKTGLHPASALTAECWIKLNSTAQNGFAWAMTQDYTTGRSAPFSSYALMTNDGGLNAWTFWFDVGGGISRINYAGGRDTNWHFLAGTFTSGAEILYLDGLSVGSAAVAGSLSYSSSGLFSFGRNSDGGENINAALSGCHVSSATRSPDWIATEYANQHSLPAMGVFTATSEGTAPGVPPAIY